MEGTSPDFARHLWAFWMREDYGPGWLQEKPLKCPYLIARKPLDMAVLWHEVNRHGGYLMVTQCKHWRHIGKMFNPPPTCTNLSYLVKKCYEYCLLELEDVLRRELTEVEGIELPEVTVDLSEFKPQRPTTKRVKTPKEGDGEARSSQRAGTRRSTLRYGSIPKTYGEELIGKKIRIFWPTEKRDYNGKIIGYSKDTRSHLIEYSDGESYYTDLSKEEGRFTIFEGGEAEEGKEAKRRRVVSETHFLKSTPYDALESRPRHEPAQQQLAAGGQGAAAAAAAVAKVSVTLTTRPVKVVDASGQREDNANMTVASKYGDPQACGITQVKRADDGFEIYALLPGFTVDEVFVSCSEDGRVLLECKAYGSEVDFLKPIEQMLKLDRKLDTKRTVAILTLHGLLYIKVFLHKDQRAVVKLREINEIVEKEDVPMTEAAAAEAAEEPAETPAEVMPEETPEEVPEGAPVEVPGDAPAAEPAAETPDNPDRLDEVAEASAPLV
uniref:ARID domain-containing protein n=2 Tax=Eukaryota TaxID=2759 RepID=A0A7S2Z480_9CHLO